MTLRNALIGALVLGFASSTALAQDPEAGDVEPVEESGSLEESSTPGLSLEGRADKPFSAGLLLGYGIAFDDFNVWGLGFGLRGGYNLEAADLPEVYLGARFMYYLGEDPVNHWELGVEGGYELTVDPVIIRPALGLGLANVTVEIPPSIAIAASTSETASEMYLYIALGGTVLYDINEEFFIGGEMNLQFILADETLTALTILANGGMRF